MKHSIRKGWRALPVVFVIVMQVALSANLASAQTVTAASERALSLNMRPSLALYVDPASGISADEAVAYALEHNGELLAARKEVEAARALVKQAGLRANPMLEVNGSKMVGGSDNSVMIAGSLPLELGGRRAARVSVAQREFEMREAMLKDRERMLAAEVRMKFGEALAGVYKLGFAEDLVSSTMRSYKLIAARVVEGNTAPLEQNMMIVEVNRMRSMRETAQGHVQVSMLELRNLMGMRPDEPLALRGDLTDNIENLPPVEEVTEAAIKARPDVEAARTAERLAEAQIAEARAEGSADASVTAGYQRMQSGFPVSGINEKGELMPVMDTFHSMTFGVAVNLPVRNKNQGAIEAAIASSEAAKHRREFAELTVRREVAAAYARYERAGGAMKIYEAGVQNQASANLEVVRKTYELGAKSLLDYIAEQRRFIEVRVSFIDAVLDTYQARVEIERASNAEELIKR